VNPWHLAKCNPHALGWSWFGCGRRRPRAGVAAPATPDPVTLQSVDVDGFQVSWETSGGETGIEIWVSYAGAAFYLMNSENDDPNPALPAATPWHGSVISIGGGNPYDLTFLRFKVRSFNAGGYSPFSTPIQIPPFIEVPDLDVDQIGDDAELTWTDTAEYGNTEVWRSIDGGAFVMIDSRSNIDGYFFDNSAATEAALISALEVRYYVRTTNPGGSGPISDVVQLN